MSTVRAKRFILMGAGALVLASFACVPAARAQDIPKAKRFAITLGELISTAGAEEIADSSGYYPQPVIDASADLTSTGGRLPIFLSAFGKAVLPTSASHDHTGDIFNGFEPGTVTTTTSIYALGLSARYVMIDPGHSLRPYIGVGEGIFHMKSHVNDFEPAVPASSFMQADPAHATQRDIEGTYSGYTVTGGLETRAGFLFEVEYLHIDRKNEGGFGVKGNGTPSGMSFSVGYCF